MKYRIIEVALGFMPQFQRGPEWAWEDFTNDKGAFLSIESAKDAIKARKKSENPVEVKVVWEDDSNG